MRKIIEAFNYDVSNLFNLPDEEESGAAYGSYIQGTKQYKDLVKLMKKYHVEGDTVYKISVGSGHFDARFKIAGGTIDMDETGYTFTPRRALSKLDDKDLEIYANLFKGVKDFCDAVMKLNLDEMDSSIDY